MSGRVQLNLTALEAGTLLNIAGAAREDIDSYGLSPQEIRAYERAMLKLVAGWAQTDDARQRLLG